MKCYLEYFCRYGKKPEFARKIGGMGFKWVKKNNFFGSWYEKQIINGHNSLISVNLTHSRVLPGSLWPSRSADVGVFARKLFFFRGGYKFFLTDCTAYFKISLRRRKHKGLYTSGNKKRP